MCSLCCAATYEQRKGPIVNGPSSLSIQAFRLLKLINIFQKLSLVTYNLEGPQKILDPGRPPLSPPSRASPEWYF